jgi:hypothetical protein
MLMKKLLIFNDAMSVISMVLLHLFRQLLGGPAAEEGLLVVVEMFDVLDALRQVRPERLGKHEGEQTADQSAAAENDEGNVVGGHSG